jgi:hypothetical protein
LTPRKIGLNILVLRLVPFTTRIVWAGLLGRRGRSGVLVLSPGKVGLDVLVLGLLPLAASKIWATALRVDLRRVVVTGHLAPSSTYRNLDEVARARIAPTQAEGRDIPEDRQFSPVA